MNENVCDKHLILKKSFHFDVSFFDLGKLLGVPLSIQIMYVQSAAYWRAYCLIQMQSNLLGLPQIQGGHCLQNIRESILRQYSHKKGEVWWCIASVSKDSRNSLAREKECKKSMHNITDDDPVFKCINNIACKFF